MVTCGQSGPSGTNAAKGQAEILNKTGLAFADASSPYAILDFLDHSNVGDSAIFLGELAWLKAAIGRDPSYVCSMRSYTDDIDRQLPDGTIYLHGGGNFGDVWPRHQVFCENIM